MYQIKNCYSDLELEQFIKEVNENNYEIISVTEFRNKIVIIYKVEKKRTRKVKQVEEEKEGDK